MGVQIQVSVLVCMSATEAYYCAEERPKVRSYQEVQLKSQFGTRGEGVLDSVDRGVVLRRHQSGR